MKDISFKIIKMESNKEYPSTTIYAICIQDKISLTVEMTNEDIKDKEFVKSILRAKYNEVIKQKHIEELKIGDIL